MTKRSVALVIDEPDHDGRVLLVQRPSDDQDLPDAWGLPAASLGTGESWDDAARRAGREKLGVELDIGPVLEQGTLQRSAYRLEMRLVRARIRTGVPHVPQSRRDVTQYRDWRWGPVAELAPAAALGSLCARLGLAWHSRTTA